MTFEINIARKYRDSDWDGLPAYTFYARVHLHDTFDEKQAKNEFLRLSYAYPSPDFSLTLSSTRNVVKREEIMTTNPRHLQKAVTKVPHISEMKDG